ncbi:MAG TPA: hypothetical protein VKA84_23965 [Gemmatimonadaceae bacterium]|nr:hypothetical protein [Gemmatimonadaceae bacterium]
MRRADIAGVVRLGAAAMVVLAAAGCHDQGPAPLPTRLDAAAVDAKVAALEAYFGGPTLRGIIWYEPENYLWYDAPAAVASRVAAGRRPALSVLATGGAAATVEPLLPARSRGWTFVRDLLGGGWRAADGRPGAPPDGVRFVFNARDARGAWTTAEAGWVDVRDVSASAGPRLTAEVFATSGAKVMHYEVSRTTPPGAEMRREMRGYVELGGRRLEFFDVHQSDLIRGPHYDLVEGWSMASEDISWTEAYDYHALPTDSLSEEVRIGRTAVRVLRRVAASSSGYVDPYDQWPNVLLNERLYAVPDPGDGVVWPFTRPDGSPMPADEKRAFTRLGTLAAIGSWPLVVETTISYWIEDLAGDPLR